MPPFQVLIAPNDQSTSESQVSKLNQAQHIPYFFWIEFTSSHSLRPQKQIAFITSFYVDLIFLEVVSLYLFGLWDPRNHKM